MKQIVCGILFVLAVEIQAQSMDMRMILDMMPPGSFSPRMSNPDDQKMVDIQSYFLESMFLKPLMNSSDELTNEEPNEDDAVPADSTKGMMSGLMTKMLSGQLSKKDSLRLNRIFRPRTTTSTGMPETARVGASQHEQKPVSSPPHHIQLGWSSVDSL